MVKQKIAESKIVAYPTTMFFFIALTLLSLTGCHKQLSFDERCKQEAREQTHKICPRSISEGILLDSITYDIKSHTLSYCYTMSGPFDNQQAIDNGKAKFHEEMKDQVINSLELKEYKEHGITFRYVYFSSSKKNIILEEVFTKQDYQVKH